MKTPSAAALIANESTRASPNGPKLNVLIVMAVIIQPLVIMLLTCKLVWKFSERIEDVLFACDSVIKAVHVVWTVGVAMENIISLSVGREIHRESHLPHASIPRTRRLSCESLTVTQWMVKQWMVMQGTHNLSESQQPPVLK